MSSALGRPLPLITQDNEFFWTSGADGKLRFQECKACAALIHPPAPVCRYCRSRDIGVRAVSGKATLAGFTLNQRFSLPGMPAPYVVAQVAIAEDPRVRLTTNIVQADPDDLELGQQVEVVFEQHRGCLAAAVSADPGRRARSVADRRDRTRTLRRIRPADAHHREVRRQSRTDRDRYVADRSPAHATAAIADRAGVRGGHRRCRTDIRRHRRALDLPGPAQRRRHGGRRCHCAGGRARNPADVAQRHHGDVRPRRLGDLRDACDRVRAGASRAVLPDALGSHQQRADEAGQDHPVDGQDVRAGRCRSAPPRRPTPWR